MPLLLRNRLKLGQKLLKIRRIRIGYFVLEIEKNTLGSRHCDRVFTLVILNQLPKRIRSIVLLERYGHDLVFFNLSPLDAIYVKLHKSVTLVPFKVYICINCNFVDRLSFG